MRRLAARERGIPARPRVPLFPPPHPPLLTELPELNRSRVIRRCLVALFAS